MSHSLRRGLVFAGFCLALGTAMPLLSRGDGPPLGEKYALLVGVRNYDKNELRDLPYAEADMTALADVLKNAGYKRVVLMTQTHGADEARFLPMAANIRTTLKGMLEDLFPSDSVLVAFAGHGVQYKDEAENYFCPMDAKLADRSTLISLGEVYQELEKAAAGTRLLLADCCRNDPRSDQARAVDKVKLESVTRPQRAVPPGGVAAFFSCSAGEKAYEDTASKHGVFFHFIIEGLQGKADQDKDGKVDLDALVRYTKKQVSDFVKETYGDNVRQMPEVVGKTHGLVALVNLDGGGRPDATTEETALKDDYTVAKLSMKLKLIKPGKFLMGSLKEEKGRDDDDREGPQHEVEITKAYYMGVYPVTKGQFTAFVQDSAYQTDGEKDGKGGHSFNTTTFEWEQKAEYTWRNPGFSQGDDHPVVDVSWNDARAFCAWLSKKEGKTYELPTEAEWEYACRAGTTTRFWCGDTDASLQGNANIIDASLKRKLDSKPPKDWVIVPWDDGYAFTAPVGSFKANPWGLYDMGGNAFQWCADGYDEYQEGSIKDPKGNESAKKRVVRGGGWLSDPNDVRSADRDFHAPANRCDVLGFRVVLRPPARTR